VEFCEKNKTYSLIMNVTSGAVILTFLGKGRIPIDVKFKNLRHVTTGVFLFWAILSLVSFKTSKTF
jgi:hypothetical protein